MDKQQKDYGYITKYKMSGTTYEVKKTFSGTETFFVENCLFNSL